MKTVIYVTSAILLAANTVSAGDPNLRRHSSHASTMTTGSIQPADNGYMGQGEYGGSRPQVGIRDYIDPTANRFGDGAPYAGPRFGHQ